MSNKIGVKMGCHGSVARIVGLVLGWACLAPVVLGARGDLGWTPKEFLGPNSFKAQERRLRELLLDSDEKSSPSVANRDPQSAAFQETNPCLKVRCGVGELCYINDETGEAYCDCIKDCGYETDPRRKVCSNHNETYSNDCEIHKLRCLCEKGDLDRCQNPEKHKHAHVEYYGECRIIPECSTAEMEDFPRRMREWLFNIMKELADRAELSYHYQEMEREAEDDYSRRWANAVIWKWCDLDGNPKDGSISRHELFPIKAPLQALEHCIGIFLDGCDANDDHTITLKEWGKCLEIPEMELQLKCEGVDKNI